MNFLTPYAVLSIVLWSVLLFVVAPHLDVISKPAARTVRIASFAQLLQPVLPFALYMGRIEVPLLNVVAPVLTAAFWGGLAVAAWQLVQGAPPKKELL